MSDYQKHLSGKYRILETPSPNCESEQKEMGRTPLAGGGIYLLCVGIRVWFFGGYVPGQIYRWIRYFRYHTILMVTSRRSSSTKSKDPDTNHTMFGTAKPFTMPPHPPRDRPLRSSWNKQNTISNCSSSFALSVHKRQWAFLIWSQIQKYVATSLAILYILSYLVPLVPAPLEPWLSADSTVTSHHNFWMEFALASVVDPPGHTVLLITVLSSQLWL